MKLTALILLLAIFFIVPSVASAQLADSPWPMIHRDLRHTGLSPYSTAPLLAIAIIALFLWRKTQALAKVILGLIILLAIGIRLYINFHSHLMPGVNAVYYPVQVRSLLQKGQLAFPDLPFVFYLEALWAKLLSLLGLCHLQNCIILSSKIIDALLYPLIAIPTFLLARTIVGRKGPKWIPLSISALTAISGFTLIMMADFQKNAVGLMFSVFFIYFLYQGTVKGKTINYLWAGIFFILTSLTHLGALGFIIAFSLLFFLFSFITVRERRIDLIKKAVLFLLVLAFASTLLFLFDPERWKTLFGVIIWPFKIFKEPIIIGMLNGQVPADPPLLSIFIIANLIAILGLVLLVAKGKDIPPQEKTLFLTSLSMTFLMAFPFMEAQLANRLWLMAYVPVSLVVTFLLHYIYRRWLKILLATLILTVMILPTPVVAIVRGAPSISEEAYHDLFKIKNMIDNPDKTLVITRHGLEWWTAWVMEVDVSQAWRLTEEGIKDYEDIYYLKQKSGQGNFGPFGPGGPPFPEAEIPPQAKIVYEDEFFILAKALPGFLQYYQKEKRGEEENE